jgi:anti-anti-sigma factor
MSQDDAIRIEVNDAYILCVAASALMDDEYSDRLETAVIKAAHESPSLPVVLDLGQVLEISDDSLGDLVDLLHHCRENDQRLILAGLQPGVLQIMSVTKLGRLFEYREDVEDAVTHLQASRD